MNCKLLETLSYVLFCFLFPGPSMKRDFINVFGITWVNNNDYVVPWIKVYVCRKY